MRGSGLIRVGFKCGSWPPKRYRLEAIVQASNGAVSMIKIKKNPRLNPICPLKQKPSTPFLSCAVFNSTIAPLIRRRHTKAFVASAGTSTVSGAVMCRLA
ncbi:hypothetical protein ES319_D03G169900v1 [Gossypium barbadense]|uniref:Uncharacterized protein n=2 Tax=Gossypium TaxID=3633 RepID=A0A5J5S708_GOSBA|nr:hypothetical protein ES319_D03G169900v1 [Gossypium barbadense]TYG77280.1 hypothetical protein ES288_D03G181800v1 [Gossypium darwinii]